MKKLDINNNAPICLFTFNRLNETKQTIKALRDNNLASVSDLYIFSDGPRRDSDLSEINRIREYISTLSGFKSITVIAHDVNKGLANSIIEGVSLILRDYGKVIVLEDDLITAPNFLDFMNQALDFYSGHEKIHSISGYSLDLSSLRKYEDMYYFGLRAFSWGWATWNDKWFSIDWNVSDYADLKNRRKNQIDFKKGGSDLVRMLDNQMTGKIDSWAIRWCYHQYKNKLLTVFPSVSKISNIGFNEKATHTRVSKRFLVKLDKGDNTRFVFNKDIELNKNLLKEFRWKFSIPLRLKDKLELIFKSFFKK